MFYLIKYQNIINKKLIKLKIKNNFIYFNLFP